MEATAAPMTPRAARPRVLMLACMPFPSRQGSQVMIRDLALMLQAYVADLTLVSYQGADRPAYPFDWLSTPALGIGMRAGPAWQKPVADAWLLRKALWQLRVRPHALIHAHNIEALTVGLALRAFTNVPLVYHAHTAMTPELPSYFAGRMAKRTARGLGRALDHSLPRLADAVVVFDRRQRTLYEQLGVAASRLTVIPAGIDPSLLPQADAPTTRAWLLRLGDGPKVLYAGNPDGYQNLPLLLKAFARVHRARPGVTLVLASPHPAESFAPWFGNAGIPPGVRVEVLRTPEDLAALLALAQVGVSPRVMPVGTPIKVLTYLAAGVPVVACADGAWDMVPEGTGRLVAASPEAFAEALLTELTTPRPTRPTLPEAFDVRSQVEAYRTLYEAVSRSRAGATTRSA